MPEARGRSAAEATLRWRVLGGGALGAAVGAITQRLIGWAVQNLSFAPVFAVCSVMYLLAFTLVHLLIGELGRIRQLPAATQPNS